MSYVEKTRILLTEYAGCIDKVRRQEIEGDVVQVNTGLIHKLAHKYRGTGIDYDDLFSLGMMAMMKAVRSYDLTKGYKFSTFFSTLLRNEILQFHRKEKKHLNQVNIDDVLKADANGSQLTFADLLEVEGPSVEEIVELTSTLDTVVKIAPEVLSEPELELFEHIVSNGQVPKQREGARLLGVSQPHVSRTIKKMQKKLKQAIEEPQKEVAHMVNKPKRRRGRPPRSNKLIEASGITKQAYLAEREKGRKDKEIADTFGLPIHDLRSFKKENGLIREYSKKQGRQSKKASPVETETCEVSTVEAIRLAEERVRLRREELRREEDHLHDLLRRHLHAI